MKNTQWFQELQKSAEAIGARIYLIENLILDYTKTFSEAALLGGPQTIELRRDDGDNIFQVVPGRTSKRVATEETIVLFNWPKGNGEFDKHVRWGISNGLLTTTPLVPFAIGEQYPKLNEVLGSDLEITDTSGRCHINPFPYGFMRYTISLECACSVWWRDNSKRYSSPRSMMWDNFDEGNEWLCFRKEPSNFIEPTLDFTIRVDRSVKPKYPSGGLHPEYRELELAGPAEYDLRKVPWWFHKDLKEGLVVFKGTFKCEILPGGNSIATLLNLQDGLAIQQKGIDEFRAVFGDKAVVYLWGSVTRSVLSYIDVPYLRESGDGNEIALGWYGLGECWDATEPATALRHFSY